MRIELNRQWVGAVYAEDLALLREMLAEFPSLADSAHREFDDPYRGDRYPVPTLLFAVAGPPAQVIDWRRIERPPSYEMAQLLLEAGADSNIDSSHGMPLCYARDRRIAECLIQFGADINRWTTNGGSPLFFSVWNIDPQRLKLQLEFGVDVTRCDPRTDESALHIACLQYPDSVEQQVDLLDVAKILLSQGIDANGRTKANVETQGVEGCPILFRETPLHLSAAFGPPALIELLLSHDGDASLKNQNGETPRDVAIKHERPEAIIELLT